MSREIFHNMRSQFTPSEAAETALFDRIRELECGGRRKDTAKEI